MSLDIKNDLKVSFVIPSFKNPQLTIDCVDNIKSYHQDTEIIISDDGSGSNTVHELKKIEGVKLITNFWNGGFGSACNAGISKSSGDIVILINNDIQLVKPVVDQFKDIFNSDPNIGVVGTLLYYPNGNIQHGGHCFGGEGKDLGHYDHGVHPTKAEMAFKNRFNISVTGALMAVRKSMIDHIGGFKKEYYLSYEDNELCFRAWHTGYKVYYTSDIRAIHHEGVSRGRNPMEKAKAGTWQKELFTRKQFHEDTKVYDFKNILRLIDKANGLKVSDKPLVIGVSRDGALGDCVMTTGIVDELKRRNPESKIYVSTKCSNVYMSNKNIDKIFTNKDQMLEQADEFYELDMVYENNPTKKVWEAYADHVFGEGEYEAGMVKPRLYSFLEARQSAQSKLPEEFKTCEKTCVVHPASGFWTSKRWGVENYRVVVDALKKLGYKVVQIGSGSDLELSNADVNLKDKLSLQEVFEVIKMSDLFISVDSGMAHVAMCSKTPCILLFSVADPSCFVHRWQNTIVIEPNSECKFCRNKVSGSTGFPCHHGDDHCIKSILPEEVIEAIKILEEEDK